MKKNVFGTPGPTADAELRQEFEIHTKVKSLEENLIEYTKVRLSEKRTFK